MSCYTSPHCNMALLSTTLSLSFPAILRSRHNFPTLKFSKVSNFPKLQLQTNNTCFPAIAIANSKMFTNCNMNSSVPPGKQIYPKKEKKKPKGGKKVLTAEEEEEELRKKKIAAMKKKENVKREERRKRSKDKKGPPPPPPSPPPPPPPSNNTCFPYWFHEKAMKSY